MSTKLPFVCSITLMTLSTVTIAQAQSGSDLATQPSGEMSDAIVKQSLLPSKDVSQAIEKLPKADLETWYNRQSIWRELQINADQLDEIGKQKYSSSDNSVDAAPFVVPDSMIIQFKPDVSPDQIGDYIQSNNLEVIQAFPKIGAVQVKADIAKYFKPELTDNSPNDAIIRGMISAASEFKKDSRVESATPDVLLTGKSQHESPPEITNVWHPTEITTTLGATGTSEHIDWGVTDIEADQLWDMAGAKDGVIFGVMDVGFSRHDDLVFLDFPPTAAADNHGNHVAGIGCSRHNGVGTEGVLPNCFIRARSGDVFFRSAGDNPQLGFAVLFSQILSTLYKFVSEQDDVSAFNVSLGYNWRSNFGINPDLPESEPWRQIVELQGTMLVSLLELAEEKDKVIFSAAGNDSSGISTPIGTKYASPFNWAAIKARDSGRAESGIIVGAHGPDGKRAPFSNIGADISCPGVDIESTIAFDVNNAPSSSSYGKMSGTSMASPYCAAGYILFRLVRRGYTGLEAIRCMEVSDRATENGTPRLKLTQALAACPPRS